MQAHEPWHPGRQVLGVRPVEALELPELGGHAEHGTGHPGDRAGPHPLRGGEDAPEHGEVERDPAHAQLRAGGDQLSDHELGETVLGLPVASHEVEGQPVSTPRDEGQQSAQLARAVAGQHGDTSPVRRVAQPAQGHGEAAFVTSHPPGVGGVGQALELLRGEVGVADDLHGVARPPDALDRAADRRHRRPGQRECADVDHGLVADGDGLEAGTDVGGGAVLTRRQHRRVPPEAVRLVRPRLDRGRPGGHGADRVGAGQADRRDDPVRHRSLAVGREHHRLVPSGREVAEGVALAALQDEPADVELVLRADELLGVGRPQEDDRGADQRRRREESSQGSDPVVPVPATERRRALVGQLADCGADRPDHALPARA